MNLNDLTNRLSEKQKERLRNAKSQEDLDQLFTPDQEMSSWLLVVGCAVNAEPFLFYYPSYVKKL